MVATQSDHDDQLIGPLSDLEDVAFEATEGRKPSLCDKDYDPVTFNMLKVKAADFASQITLIDLEAFKAITAEELLSGAWCKKNKRSLTPNIVNFTDRFNFVVLWCQKEILSYGKCSKRAEVMAHFIKISKRLADLNNMHSTFAIISALQSHSIHRLQRTWDCLGRHDRSTFEKLTILFDSDRNWEKLRQHLDNTNLPCIPFLGMFLTDLNFLEAKRSEGNSNPNICGRGLQAENVVCKIKWFQHSSYDHLHYIDCIQKYLASLQYHEELLKFFEDDLYKQSLSCEPNSTSPSPGLLSSDRFNRKIATVSRLRLNRSEDSHAKLKDVFHTLTPKMQHSYLTQLGHRKTRSLDARNVLGLENVAFSYEKSAVDVADRNSVSSKTKEIVAASVFYLDKTDDRFLEEVFSPCSGVETTDGKPIRLRHSSSDVRILEYTNSFSSSISTVRRKKCSTPSGLYYPKVCTSPIIENDCSSRNWQGEVRKIVVRTRGSKPAKLRCSRKCYLELNGSTLNQFEHRAIALNCKSDRDHYKKKVSKEMVISDNEWKVIGPQGEDGTDFELHHPSTGRIYRFLCESRAVALMWHSKLLEAGSKTVREPVVADLISFD